MNELWFKNHKKEKNPSFDYITNFKAPYIQTTDTWLYRPLLVNPLVSWFIHSSVRLPIHLCVCVSRLFLARMRSYTGYVSIVNKNLKWFRETRFQRKHIFMNFNCPHKEVSKVSEIAWEWSEQVKRAYGVERCGASEGTNVVSDRVAR